MHFISVSHLLMLSAMASQKPIIPLLILAFSFLVYATASQNMQPSHWPAIRSTVKAAYWPSFNDVPASTIDTRYFTHIYYAFLTLDSHSYKLNIAPDDQTKLPELVNALRLKRAPIKTLISIGGGGFDPTVFAAMARTSSTREAFIHSTIEVARRYGYDGLDLDWEFPSDDEEMSNLAILFKQWREAIARDAIISGKPPLLLTAAVYYASKFSVNGLPRSYPAHELAKYLDWASPMCFDYHGSWENFTGVNAALYDPNSNISTYYGIGSWIQAGVPPEKLVMGMPLYGRTWTLQDPNVNKIGAPAVGVGPGGGTLDYFQVIDFNEENKATVVYDHVSASYYSYAGNSWVGYDDVMSIGTKVRFARTRGLRGYFFWALGKDKNWTLSRVAANEWGH